MTYQPKRTLNIYLETDFWCDQDTEIKLRKTKLVENREKQKCMNPLGESHSIKKGTLCYYEKALVDGKWGSYYTCLECLDKYLDEMGE